jgi:acetate kinase
VSAARVRILVVNAGSSSLKLRVLDGDDAVVARSDLGAVEELGADGVGTAVEALGPVDAVGHRVVHGGTRFTAPALLDDDVVTALEALTHLAPLHQPPALAAIAAVARVLPHRPAVACFDTAFHASLHAAAATYAVPRRWREELGVRRYGFHGLSHAYAARRAGRLVGRSVDELRIVTCHLGAGASLAAVAGGRSVDTTMGFTPLEGLVMATRSGTVDPGLVLWLQEQAGLDAAEVLDGLEHSGGLLALTGTADMRVVLAAVARGDAVARQGLEVYVHRLRASIATMTAAMGGLDVLVFTGGVGERSPAVRAAAADGLEFLGVSIDAGRNEIGSADRDVGRAGAAVRTLVVEAREDIEIAKGVRAIVEIR